MVLDIAITVMGKENFLLVSLEESESKKLAEVLTNDTSRKIMNYLSEKESATETQLSNELAIPLPTVHYNLQKMKEAGLVNVEEFHYSKKGREVDHYKLANKYVIITTKPVKGIKLALRSILPVGLIVTGISFIVHFMTRSNIAGITSKRMAEVESVMLTQTSMAATEPNYALWFFAGGMIAVLIYALIAELWRHSKT